MSFLSSALLLLYCWLLFVCFMAEAQLCGVEAWYGKELFQHPRGVWGCFLWFLLHAGPASGCSRAGGVQQGRAGLLWGCWVLCAAGEVQGKLPCPSSIPATLGMVWEVARGSVHSPRNQSLCVGWAWPEEGFGSCLLAGEGVLGATVFLGGIPI